MAVQTALEQLGHSSARQNEYTALPVRETSPDHAPRGYGELESEVLELDASTPFSTSTDTNKVSGIPAAARRWPSLQTFLADFTLGFADGLTVPFALTAGLSSLGDASTVIYAGMAEICAGSISMGIGGYLAARGEARASREAQKTAAGSGSEDEASLLSAGGRGDPEKAEDEAEMSAVARYLAPLLLPPQLEGAVLAHLSLHGYDARAVDEARPKLREDEHSSFPILAGLSVSLGYLVGGVIPLFPYFLVGEVSTGLFWSFLVCIIALFIFGFGKEFALNRSNDGVSDKSSIPWSKIRSSLWEGLQMVILGGIAALAAVLCVRLFQGAL